MALTLHPGAQLARVQLRVFSCTGRGRKPCKPSPFINPVPVYTGSWFAVFHSCIVI